MLLIFALTTITMATASGSPIGMSDQFLQTRHDTPIYHFTSHQPEQIPQNTFAMTLSQLNGNLPAGSLVPAAEIGNQVALFLPDGTILHTTSALVKIITVPLGTKPTLKTYSQMIMLGFADGATSDYMQNLSQDPLSVLAPMAYQLNGSNGQLTGSLSGSVIQAAHQRNVQVWAVVASGFNPAVTTAFLENPSAEFTVLQYIASVAKTSQVDGINFDFEDMIPSDAPLYTRFITAAATVLHAMGKWVSVDVTLPSNDPNWSLIYNRSQLAKVTDYMIAMSYDQHYVGEQQIGAVAALPWVQTGINAIVQEGVSANKILLGVPFYSIDWYKSGNNWHSSYDSMYAQQRAKSEPNARTQNDAASGLNELIYSINGVTHYLWLEDTRSLTERSTLTVNNHLAGVAVWQLELGTAQNLQTLLRVF